MVIQRWQKYHHSVPEALLLLLLFFMIQRVPHTGIDPVTSTVFNHTIGKFSDKCKPSMPSKFMLQKKKQPKRKWLEYKCMSSRHGKAQN